MQLNEAPLVVCWTSGTLSTEATRSSPTPNPNSSVLSGLVASKPRRAQYTIFPAAHTGATVNEVVLTAVTPEGPCARTEIWMGESAALRASPCQMLLSMVQPSDAEYTTRS